ncbi:MAG: protein arginine kinase [Planctomycetes bacterium]|nr:protein arginine kinase [Planctomycetota bacterium]
MEINDLCHKTGEWLRGTGPESDIVISTRVRLARNVAHFPFLTRVKPEQKQEIEAYLRERVMRVGIDENLLYVNLADTEPVDRLFLVERHLISREHADGDGQRGVAFGRNEVVSLMVNEEDHLRIQVLRSGLELRETWERINHVDDLLATQVNYAFSSRFGYLTACPTNAGTGLRASVMLHLPALSMARQIEKVFNAVGRLNLVVRGLYGEGTQASGDLYQISNQVTLGKSETDILKTIESVIPRITSYERMARKHLVEENRAQIEDRVWRSYGMLRTARTISSEETLHLLSQVRMGVNLGLIDNVKMKTVNELFILTLPAHLQKMQGRELDPDERNVVRASFVRSRLGV